MIGKLTLTEPERTEISKLSRDLDICTGDFGHDCTGCTQYNPKNVSCTCYKQLMHNSAEWLKFILRFSSPFKVGDVVKHIDEPIVMAITHVASNGYISGFGVFGEVPDDVVEDGGVFSNRDPKKWKKIEDADLSKTMQYILQLMKSEFVIHKEDN